MGVSVLCCRRRGGLQPTRVKARNAFVGSRDAFDGEGLVCLEDASSHRAKTKARQDGAMLPLLPAAEKRERIANA